MAPSYMHHLPHFCDKQDCVQMINIEKIEEFESIVAELAGNLTPKFSDFVRSVIPKCYTLLEPWIFISSGKDRSIFMTTFHKVFPY